jgi:hypothetical protein
MNFVSSLRAFVTRARLSAAVSSLSILAIVIVGAAGTKWA